MLGRGGELELGACLESSIRMDRAWSVEAASGEINIALERPCAPE